VSQERLYGWDFGAWCDRVSLCLSYSQGKRHKATWKVLSYGSKPTKASLVWIINDGIGEHNRSSLALL
jgi:hypothetical protein